MDGGGRPAGLGEVSVHRGSGQDRRAGAGGTPACGVLGLVSPSPANGGFNDNSLSSSRRLGVTGGSSPGLPPGRADAVPCVSPHRCPCMCVCVPTSASRNAPTHTTSFPLHHLCKDPLS